MFMLIALVMASSVTAMDLRLLKKSPGTINNLKEELPGQTNLLGMPCTFSRADHYKFFQFFDLSQKNYETVFDKTSGAVFSICTTPKIPEHVTCQEDFEKKGAYMYGFTYSQVSGKTVCKPIFVADKANTWSYKLNTSDNKKNKGDIVNVIMDTQTTKTSKKALAYTTEFKFICDSSAAKQPEATAAFNADQTKLTITMKNKNACGVDMRKIVIFTQKYNIIPILFILISLPLIFFGLKFIKASLATVGSITALFIVAYIACTLFNFMTWKTKQWIFFFVIALIVSCIAAYICYQSPNIAVMVGGILLGYLAGIKLVQLYATIAKVSPSGMVIGMVAGVFMVLGLILAWKIKNHAVILTTSFGGAQLLAFGIGTLAGNYPDFRLISAQIKTGNKKIGTANWCYIIGTFLVFIIGAVHQYKKYLKKAEENSSDEYGQMSQDMKDGGDFGNAGYY